MNIFGNGSRLPVSVALAIALIASWPGGVHADGDLPDCYLLSAAVDHYPNMPKLSGCLNDARNTTKAFQAQQGLLFGKVHPETLLDCAATQADIHQKFRNFAKQGKAGDFMVLFLSGHGGRTNNNQVWFFVPFDFNPRNEAATTLTDRQILEASDTLVKQGKKVLVIVDACFAGQLRISAKTYLNRYTDPAGGGLILMLSSMPNQTSNVLGDYSAFAKAVADALAGHADLNHDGKISLKEIQQYSHGRTYQLLREKGNSARQDSEIAWSPSISEHMPLALTNRLATTPPANPSTANAQPVHPPAVGQRPARATHWLGSEDLSGYGKLAFQMLPDGRAIMHDSSGTTEGSWQQKGKQFTLTFSAGRVSYTRMLKGSTLSGTARNARTSWSWNVQADTRDRPATVPSGLATSRKG